MLHESVQRWQDCPIHIPKSRIIRRGQIIPYIGYVRWRCEICKNYPSRTLNNSAPRFCIWTLPSWKVILLVLSTFPLPSDYCVGGWYAFRKMGRVAVGQDFERVRRRIQKLGAYFGGAMCIAKVCQDIERRGLELSRLVWKPASIFITLNN